MYLPVIKWKWIFIKIFILIVFILSRLSKRKEEGLVGLAVLGGGRDGRKFSYKWTCMVQTFVVQELTVYGF